MWVCLLALLKYFFCVLCSCCCYLFGSRKNDFNFALFALTHIHSFSVRLSLSLGATRECSGFVVLFCLLWRVRNDFLMHFHNTFTTFYPQYLFFSPTTRIFCFFFCLWNAVQKFITIVWSFGNCTLCFGLEIFCVSIYAEIFFTFVPLFLSVSFSLCRSLYGDLSFYLSFLSHVQSATSTVWVKSPPCKININRYLGVKKIN